MNICLISREYPPFFGGGIGAYTVRWSRSLAAAGHRVVVITVSDDGRPGRDRDGDVVIVRLPFIRGSGQTGDWSGPHPLISTPSSRAAFAAFSPVAVFSMQIAAALPSLTREFAIDIVEAPDTGALAWFPLNERLTSPAHSPAFVTCMHSPTEWIAHWNRAPLSGRQDTELIWMERDSASWSDAIVAPSTAMAAWAAEHWGLTEVATIPYPLGELEPVARAAATSPAAPTGSRSVVFIGRLEPRKGVRVLLEGFALAVSRGADLTLDLAGEDMPDRAGPHGARLIAALPEPVRARVRALGRLQAPALDALRAGALAVAIPSPMDNFPNTCMEAMAQGKLIIAANAGGMAQMIRADTDGLLFEPETAASCAAALARAAAMSPQVITSTGRSAASRILDLCGNDAIVRRRIQHYQQTLTRPRAAPRSSAEYTVLGASRASRARAEHLARAAADAGADFAHGWTMTPDGKVRAFSTPRAQTLGLSSGPLGPLAVRRDLAASIPWGISTRDAALRLVSEGARGIVVPGVLTEDPRPAGTLARLLRAASARLSR